MAEITRAEAEMEHAERVAETRRSLLVGPRVSLRPVSAEDGDEFVALARGSATLHEGLISAPTSAAEFGAYVARLRDADAAGFVIRLRGTDELVGFVNIRNIAATPRRSGSLGYGGFAGSTGHGYVTEGVGLAVRHAFEKLGLVRLEAHVQPANTASMKVVQRAGFRRDGATEAICIVGEWRHHERWTLTPGDGYRKRVYRS